jgi:hypothetical protein
LGGGKKCTFWRYAIFEKQRSSPGGYFPGQPPSTEYSQ